MDRLQQFLARCSMRDDDIDGLLECADFTRALADRQDYACINRLLLHMVEKGCNEAFVWTVGVIAEKLAEGTIMPFDCLLGGRIPNYDDFVALLQVDFNPLKNFVEKIYDKNGEVESFFNIFVYTTAFENMYLVSAENFDTRDNDFIQYKLAFGLDVNSTDE